MLIIFLFSLRSKIQPFSLFADEEEEKNGFDLTRPLV